MLAPRFGFFCFLTTSDYDYRFTPESSDESDNENGQKKVYRDKSDVNWLTNIEKTTLFKENTEMKSKKYHSKMNDILKWMTNDCFVGPINNRSDSPTPTLPIKYSDTKYANFYDKIIMWYIKSLCENDTPIVLPKSGIIFDHFVKLCLYIEYEFSCNDYSRIFYSFWQLIFVSANIYIFFLSKNVYIFFFFFFLN